MTCHPALNEILLDHLQRAWAHLSPGLDGLTVDAVLEFYSQAAAAGQVPNKEELLRQYPHLAAELETFFTAAQACSEKAPTDQSSGLSTAAVRVDSIAWD
jgi:2-oxo-4-hydroxy-4-carboxy--5-ureidoimidazoline (OHCU) decarboxylase